MIFNDWRLQNEVAEAPLPALAAVGDLSGVGGGGRLESGQGRGRMGLGPSGGAERCGRAVCGEPESGLLRGQSHGLATAAARGASCEEAKRRQSIC